MVCIVITFYCYVSNLLADISVSGKLFKIYFRLATLQMHSLFNLEVK